MTRMGDNEQRELVPLSHRGWDPRGAFSAAGAKLFAVSKQQLLAGSPLAALLVP